MNIQIFTDKENNPMAIDMEHVCAIRRSKAEIIIIGDRMDWEKGAHIRKFIDNATSEENDKTPCYAIEASLLLKHCVECVVSIEFTPAELWETMGASPVDEETGKPWDEESLHGGIFENFTDEEAMRIMIKYWKDLQDTPLTKRMNMGKGRVE